MTIQHRFEDNRASLLVFQENKFRANFGTMFCCTGLRKTQLAGRLINIAFYAPLLASIISLELYSIDGYCPMPAGIVTFARDSGT